MSKFKHVGVGIVLLLIIIGLILYFFLRIDGQSKRNSGLLPPTSKAPTDKFIWMAKGRIQGVTGRYTPLIITGANTVSVYGNYDNTDTFDGLYLRTGNWANVGMASLVISKKNIIDQSGKPFIRTSGIVRDTKGKYFAVIHVGDGYPSSTGYIPAWATSDDGIQWDYHGKFIVEGVPMQYIYSSSANLIVQEEKPGVLNNEHPMENRYLVWEDATTMIPSKKLILLYSADGADWRFYRDTSGEIVDVWPVELASDPNPMFPTAARTPYGYHLIAADNYPVNYQRHLFSCDGLKWRVLEYQSATFMSNVVNPKGTNLVYEPTTGLLHALTSGYLFQEQEHILPCS